MLKLTKTGIGLLTKQYRSVLRKCLLLNLGFIILEIGTIQADIIKDSSDRLVIDLGFDADGGDIRGYNSLGKLTFRYANTANKTGDISLYDASSSIRANISANNTGGGLRLFSSSGQANTILSDSSFKLNGSAISATGIVANAVQNSTALITSGGVYDALNYYYTFRMDERVEVIEFAKELRINKKEMSSLDFMPIKSSRDLRINLIKAEDPLTFSAKTRDDSLVLMEVCHA